MLSLRRSLYVLVLFALTSSAVADVPAAYDLRDVDGQQYVSTRIDDQVGPGPCWAFATLTAVESNIRLRGLWDGAANDLNLSEQFLRCNETTGTTWPELSSGFNRSVNAGGRAVVAVSHMARLHGPLYESQVPFEYHEDNIDYYDPDHYLSWDGNPRPNPAYPLWPHARPYPAEHTSDLEGAYFLEKAYRVSGQDAIKQAVMDVGACYVSIYHRFDAFDVDTGTYYDDGGVEGEGLGAHGVNIIGWDDSKVVPGAPAAGAWLIKQSHEVDDQDMLYPHRAGEAPTYFWISYETSPTRFTDNGAVEFFEMGSMEDIQSVHFHDFTGNLNSGSGYFPSEDAPDYSVCAQRFVANDEGDAIGIVSFFTRDDDQPFEVKIYDSIADLQSDAAPLASLSGTADTAGYHTFDLGRTVDIAPNDDFVVFLDFTDGGRQVVAYDRDGTGYTGSIEQIQQDWCYYFDQNSEQWKDLTTEWPGQAFTVKAYGVVPEPTSLTLLAVFSAALLRRRRRA